jgi:2-polyprenyl-3-methyl-5-hydroxy-6-metoxy-1,4-benzoquinol methylase
MAKDLHDHYTASYYTTSNYADYLERADRYKKTAYELTDLLRKLSLLNKDSKIVDYGCAIGFLLEGFKELGYSNLMGYEVSDWAILEGQARGNRVAKWDGQPKDGSPTDVLFALDVFEHMEDRDIENVLRLLSPKAMVVRIPSSVDGGQTFALKVSQADPTHINCKTKEQWAEFFKDRGYQTFLRLNLFTVYDTPGVSCFLCLHG